METFTVNMLGRSTSRIAFEAERGPVEITRRDKRVAVVLSPADWAVAEKAMDWYHKTTRHRRVRASKEDAMDQTGESPGEFVDGEGRMNVSAWEAERAAAQPSETPASPEPRSPWSPSGRHPGSELAGPGWPPKEATQPPETSGSRACTGLTARWCPIHGTCTCPNPADDDDFGPSDLNSPDCPLHSSESSHAEPETPASPEPPTCDEFEAKR